MSTGRCEAQPDRPRSKPSRATEIGFMGFVFTISGLWVEGLVLNQAGYWVPMGTAKPGIM